MAELKIADAPAGQSDSHDFVRGFGALSRDMLATVLDQSVDCVKILDAEGRIDFMNRNGRGSMEIADFGTIAGQAWPTLWPEEARPTVAKTIAAARAGESSRFEAFCPTAKGTPKWWDVSVSPVRDKSGAVVAIVSMSRDVTDRRTAMDSLETMAQEMRHRLRNAYAVSGAIALASGREDPAHLEFARTLAQRLNSLSAVQSSLIDPGAGERLPVLVRRIADAFGNGGELVCGEGLPDVALGEQAVRLLALVLGELATNSLKHGALGAGLPISISGTCDGQILRLGWRETLAAGAERLVAPPSDGSGHRLMQRMASVHGGRFEVTIGDDQLEAMLETPVAR